jgi:hypothetical protein
MQEQVVATSKGVVKICSTQWSYSGGVFPQAFMQEVLEAAGATPIPVFILLYQ